MVLALVILSVALEAVATTRGGISGPTPSGVLAGQPNVVLFAAPSASDPPSAGIEAVSHLYAVVEYARAEEEARAASVAGETATSNGPGGSGQPRQAQSPDGLTSPAATSWPASLYPCGGDLPPCYVKQRESHGDYNARNNASAGSACGAWQIIGSTWAGFGGYPDACSAPPGVQDEKARQLWAGGAGCSHWSAC